MDPRTSLSLSPIRSRTRHTETQTSESSFSTVQDSTLSRFCGEGRKDTKALWIGCSHVSQRGRVKQTCEYWVHALCVGITATTKAPLSRIGWKCPHHIMIAKDNAKDKNKKSKWVIGFFYFKMAEVTFSSLSMHLQTFLHFSSSGTPFWIHIFVFLFLASNIKSPPSPLASLPETL